MLECEVRWAGQHCLQTEHHLVAWNRRWCSILNPSGFVSANLQIWKTPLTLVIPIPKVLFTTFRAEKHLQYKGTQKHFKAANWPKYCQILAAQKEEKATLWFISFNIMSIFFAEKYTRLILFWTGSFWKGMKYPRTVFHLCHTLPADLPESRIYLLREQKKQGQCGVCTIVHPKFSAFSFSLPR